MSQEIFPEKLTKIEFAIADEMRISVKDLRSRSVRRELSQARQIIWAICVLQLEYSYNRLGRFYKRDHSTILHGVQKMEGSTALKHGIKAVKDKYPEVFGEE